MAPIPKTPRTPRTPSKSLRTPKSTLKTPRSLKAPRTLKTPRRLKAPAGRSAKTPRANAKPVTIGDMVFEAVEALNDRRGVSLHAIKKYLRDSRKVDTEAKAGFIKKYLKAFVEEGKLVQVAGTGANGTFKLPGKKPSSEKLFGGSKAAVKVASRPKIGRVAGRTSAQPFAKMSDKSMNVPKKTFKGKIAKR
ncbi:histone H1-like [Penaeus japonicus]|uniref:histone H1-like n=1 Tax=Penaeus japonicus TaxID=27405 RepID=UPI001C7100EA|nr:histone H1-like [Penaeus japonicus]